MVLGYTPKTAGGGEFASGDMGVITDLCRPAKKHHDQVLTVLCLPQKGESAKKYFYENLGTMTFVELTQDVIHGERAKTALLSMAAWKRTLGYSKIGRRTGVTGLGNCANFSKNGSPTN